MNLIPKILFILLTFFCFTSVKGNKIYGDYQLADSVLSPSELDNTQWNEMESHGYIGVHKKELWYRVQLHDPQGKILHFSGVRVFDCELWIYENGVLKQNETFGSFYGNNEYYHGEHLKIDVSRKEGYLVLYFKLKPTFGQTRLPFYLSDKREYNSELVDQKVFKSVWLGILLFFISSFLALGVVLKKKVFYHIFTIQLSVFIYFGLGESGLILDFIDRDKFNVIYFIKGFSVVLFSYGNWMMVQHYSTLFIRWSKVLKTSLNIIHFTSIGLVAPFILWVLLDDRSWLDDFNRWYVFLSRIAALNILSLMLVFLLFERKTKSTFLISLPMVCYLCYASFFSILMSEGFIAAPKNYLVWIYSFSLVEILLYSGVIIVEFNKIYVTRKTYHRGQSILRERVNQLWQFLQKEEKETEVLDDLLKEVRQYSHLLNIKKEDVENDFEKVISKLFNFYSKDSIDIELSFNLNEIGDANRKLKWKVYQIVYDFLQSIYFNYPEKIWFNIESFGEKVELSIEITFVKKFSKTEMEQVLNADLYTNFLDEHQSYLKIDPEFIYLTVVLNNKDLMDTNLKKILDENE